MANVMDVLRERGYIKQTTFEDDLYEMLGNQSVTFYVGFDPTADSLHIGHYIPVMVMTHLQRAGHKPIALVGGGTGMVGDPSGRTDMRRMLTNADVDHNVACIKNQLGRFLDFDPEKPNCAVMANNADWLLKLNYVDFLRDVGVHFSVNRMLTAECYKNRLEKGLSFLEFNYMLMQSYDFLVLQQTQNCILQVGGDDQWSNMLSGADLIRRKERKPAFAMTCQLLLNSQGQKMGKTVGGALWLDENKVSAYEFYQYWRNVDDADVERCLALLTFLPMDEVRRLGGYKDQRINESKKILAFEITKMVHGEAAAQSAMQTAEALFSGKGDNDNMPTTTITAAQLEAQGRVIELLTLCGLTKSNGEGRRLIQQGGVWMNDEPVTEPDAKAQPGDSGVIIFKKGKKGYHRILVEG